MRQVINESKQLNEHIRASEEYRTYLRTKQALLENCLLYTSPSPRD